MSPISAKHEVGRLIKYTRITPQGCWEWTGATNGVGYGIVSLYGRKWYVHRFVYEVLEGIPIPPGWHVDHLCRNTLCCRPDHLEAVTVSENIRRGLTGQKTHCKNGHPFDRTNTYISPQGHRICRACRAKKERERRVIRKAMACRS